jgi:hypothetical protein
MTGHRYTGTSDEARALGRELLRVSAIYDGPTLPHGYGAERMAVVAAVVRARRLMVSANALADRGDALEADRAWSPTLMLCDAGIPRRLDIASASHYLRARVRARGRL